MDLTKNAFRATLAMIWTVFDVVLITSLVLSNTIGTTEASASLALLPFLFLALFVGDYLHHRIDENRFRVFIYVLILVAGMSIVVK